jgi:hypothetical protein
MDYVYTQSSLSKELCEEIIDKYEKEQNLKYQGVTARGLDKNIKDTQDMMIPESKEWEEINQVLSIELQRHVKLYIERIEKGENYKEERNFGIEYKHLADKLLQENNFMIQKYDQKKGRYVYHEDGLTDQKKSRVITYLWYLNDVVEGGETEFFGGSYHIIPETGKLLLFPAVWCYPHRGNIPVSSCKYIITGWLYKEHIMKKLIMPSICLNQSVKFENPDKEEEQLIFNFFYKSNQTLFKDYKTKITGVSIFNSLEIITYTPLQCQWILSKLPNEEKIDLDTLTEEKSFLLSSFGILVDKIKETYFINCNFDIKEWNILSKPHEFDIHYDLCIQIDLLTGISYVGKTLKPLDTQIVYLIEFTFQYLDKNNEKKRLTLKDIADPCLELI